MELMKWICFVVVFLVISYVYLKLFINRKRALIKLKWYEILLGLLLVPVTTLIITYEAINKEFDGL